MMATANRPSNSHYSQLAEINRKYGAPARNRYANNQTFQDEAEPVRRGPIPTKLNPFDPKNKYMVTVSYGPDEDVISQLLCVAKEEVRGTAWVEFCQTWEEKEKVVAKARALGRPVWVDRIENLGEMQRSRLLKKRLLGLMS